MKKELLNLEGDIVSKIYVIRKKKVLLDSDLAVLYGVETKVLKQAVRRNIKRFPTDFMFELSKEEFNELKLQENLRSQFVTSRWGGNRYTPMAFTEHGVTMLSSVLKSDRAIDINVKVVRVFAKMRQVLLEHVNLQVEFEKIKRQTSNNTSNIELVFSYLDELTAKQTLQKPTTKIGYKKRS